MLEELEEDVFDDRLFSSDGVTFYVSGKVSKHNTRLCGTENPLATSERVRDASKVNVFYDMSDKCIYEPFFFEGAAVNCEASLEILKNWLKFSSKIGHHLTRVRVSIWTPFCLTD